MRGVMTITGPDGTIVVPISHDADIADIFLQDVGNRFYIPSQPLSTMHMYVYLNETYAKWNGNYFRDMGTEWLGKVVHIVRGNEMARHVKSHVANLVEMGFRDARWTVDTITGRFSQLDASRRQSRRVSPMTNRFLGEPITTDRVRSGIERMKAGRAVEMLRKYVGDI
jgi:hypothetical protein